MQVQVHTDGSINGSAHLVENIAAELTQSLSRFGDQITRVEVHLRDADGPKNASDDKSCLLEARLAGRPPVVASHDAPSLRQAIDGATTKLERAVEHVVDKLGDRKGRPSFGDESAAN